MHVGGFLMGFLSPELLALLGDPPDWSKLSEILAEHPELRQQYQQSMRNALNARGDQLMQQGQLDHNETLSKSGQALKQFGERFNNPNFASGFANFVSNLSGTGEPITAQSARLFMPKELQEAIAENRVNAFARQVVADGNPDHMTPQDAGKIALAMWLGRLPNADEMRNPSYQQYAQAGENFYQLARAGQFGTGDIGISANAGQLLAIAKGDLGRHLWAETRWAGACESGYLGCAAAVSRFLQQAGVGVDSAGVEGVVNQLRQKGWRMERATPQTIRTGEIIFGLNGSHGHIGFVGEVTNGQAWIYNNHSRGGVWAHDEISSSTFRLHGNSRFGNNIFVLVPPDAQNG
jgi:hypothetical protein